MLRTLCPSLGQLEWMRVLPPLALMPALALGCYASTELEEADPGTRLRPRVYRPASGPPALAGWQDTELDTDCRFHRVEDGGYRRIPYGSPTSMHFEDPDCRRPVARVLDCASPRFVRELVSPPTECAGSSHMRVFELEGARSAPRLYDRIDGECVVSSVTFRPSRRATRRTPPSRAPVPPLRAADSHFDPLRAGAPRGIGTRPRGRRSSRSGRFLRCPPEPFGRMAVHADYTLEDEAGARRYLHRLWLCEFEVWLRDGGAGRRLDEEYEPPDPPEYPFGLGLPDGEP